MLDKIQKLRGFREFYPHQMTARRIIFDFIYKKAKAFGFHEIDTPSLEPLDLFRIKSGEEIIQQTFSFVDKGGREVTLIPELTPSVARMIAQRKDLILPIKLFSISKMWRYEEPQSGRLREFYQFNADIFGSSKIYADAEVIALAMTILDELGLEKKYIIRMSDRVLIEEILKDLGIVEKTWEVLKIIDKREKVSDETFKNMLLNLGIKDRTIDDISNLMEIRGAVCDLRDCLGKYKQYHRLLEISELVEAYNVKSNLILDLSIVRGLAYYSSTVFEGHDTKGEFRAILGGGRYDGVVKLLGGDDVPAVGFAMGDAVLELLMRRENLWPTEKIQLDYYIATLGENAKKVGIKVASFLRKNGFSVDMDLMDRALSKQLKHASSINARYTLIIGDNEIKRNVVIVRDMVSGEQIEKNLSEFII